MALNPKLALGPALILLVVVFVVIGCVEMGYFLIFSTIIHDYKLSRILPPFADLSLSWRWWLPITCGMLFLVARRLVLRMARACPPCAANTGRQTLEPLAAKA
jgi:hypothetical protein